MKEKDARVDYDSHQLVIYVEKDDGKYGPLRTGSYLAKNYLDDYRSKRKNLEQRYVEMIRQGTKTPVEMYMILCELTLTELALRTNIPKRKIKKHMDPKKFDSVTLKDLKKYAEVFGIPAAKLINVIPGHKND